MQKQRYQRQTSESNAINDANDNVIETQNIHSVLVLVL